MDPSLIPGKEGGRISERRLDPKLWHACAGGTDRMPEVNTNVYYFPQGHAEHVTGNTILDLDNANNAPSILCSVSDVKYLVDADSDEVFAKLRLNPLPEHGSEHNIAANGHGIPEKLEYFEHNIAANGHGIPEKLEYYPKKLTQSDANNGGGFSVPRLCADKLFPPLDYSLEIPAQNIIMEDVHGKKWKFRHIFRGTPRRHLLTTGWSVFVNFKKLIAGDSVLFMKGANGNILIAIRQGLRRLGGGLEYSCFKDVDIEDDSNDDTEFPKESQNGGSNGNLDGRVSAEIVVEAATLAARGDPFEVIYHPGRKTPEFFVNASAVRIATRNHWEPNMRVKMDTKKEDSSRISWVMGTVSAVQPVDPVNWPRSPWRLLQVQWDDAELVQNFNRVNPWSVEVISNYFNFPLASPFQMSLFPSDLGTIIPLVSTLSNSTVCSGMQGTRHPRFDQPLGGLQHYNAVTGPIDATHSEVAGGNSNGSSFDTGDQSRFLNMENSSGSSKINEEKSLTFRLFGQEIPIAGTRKSLLDENSEKKRKCPESNGNIKNSSIKEFSLGKEQKTIRKTPTDRCELFMDEKDIGQTLDLSVFESYEELYKKLADIFGIESSEIVNNLVYRDESGAVNGAGQENFSELLRTARRLTVVRDSGVDNARRSRQRTISRVQLFEVPF